MLIFLVDAPSRGVSDAGYSEHCAKAAKLFLESDLVKAQRVAGTKIIILADQPRVVQRVMPVEWMQEHADNNAGVVLEANDMQLLIDYVKSLPIVTNTPNEVGAPKEALLGVTSEQAVTA